MVESVSAVLNDILRVEAIEEAFVCFLIHRPNSEEEKLQQWHNDLSTALRGASSDQLEAALRHYLFVGATQCSLSQLKLVMDLLERIVKSGIIPARLVCETLISHEKLQYQNNAFWLETFRILKSTIDLVEYKGVREIMKVVYITFK